MKKILILSTILISFFLFSGCDNPSTSTAKKDDSSSTEQKETTDDTHQKDDETDDENGSNESNEQNGKRQGAYIILSTPESATVGEEKIIRYSSVANNYSNDEYEIIIVENPKNINVSIEAFFNRIIVTGNSAGTIKFKVHNKTADCTSNECEITFNEKVANPDSGNTSSLFYGTWYCSEAGLIKYLEFNSDGTGKAYASSPSNYSSFNWNIEENILVLTGNVKARIQFSIIQDVLTFYDCELFNNKPDLIYYRQ